MTEVVTSALYYQPFSLGGRGALAQVREVVVKTRGKEEMGYTVEFEEFWSIYPKRVGKLQAFREWEKLKLNPTERAVITKHLERRVKDDVKWIPNEKGKTFIVDPERFLKYRRWEDEYERVRTKPVLEKRYYDVEQPEQAQGRRASDEQVRNALADIKRALLH